MTIVQSREDFLTQLDRMLPLKCSAMEIGVLYGDFSQQILDIINPQYLVLIDPYAKGGNTYGSMLGYLQSAYSTANDYENLLKRFRNEISAGQVVVDRKFSYDAVSDFPDNSLDFIYIDASHFYEDVKKDLNDWLPKLRPNGIISGHDYIEGNGFGVMQAVGEFIKEHKFEMFLINSDGGDWALRKNYLH
jgi:hypothetical protein